MNTTDSRIAAERRYAELTEAMGRYADGDPEAFETVYRLLAPMVERCHRRWAGPAAAEDLTQQTFMKIHRVRDRYQRGSPVGPWVLSIARHLAIDSLRKRGRNREWLTDRGHLPELTSEPVIDDRDVAEAVRAAVAELPQAQRDVIALHKLEERPFAEVADLLGIQEGAARVRAHRAYGRLRELLDAWFTPAPEPV